MSFEEKIDLTLKMLYTTVQGNGGVGGIFPKIYFEENGLELSFEEEEMIINMLHARKFISVQINKKGRYICFDSKDSGKYFVETNSYSIPGTSILNIPVKD